MNEKSIVICGHGSNTPSTKNMYSYLSNRQSQKANNGLTKGLVEVVRFLKTDEQRKTFHDTYKTILGRNLYNQNLRAYCYKKYKDGNYYSDCSSSGCLTYVKCGIPGVGSYNTAYMHYQGQKVDVQIKDGHIVESDLNKLKVGDALLFRGNDPSRPLQIGHVEYIYEMPTETKDGWVKDGNDWYFYRDGKKLEREWVRYEKHWYRVGYDGKLLTGWHQIYDQNDELAWCYFEEKDEKLLGAQWHERSDRIGFMEIWTLLE